MGNDDNSDDSGKAQKISIHVPAWGTTIIKSLRETFEEISIHVPAWGTTGIKCFEGDSDKFQSTFPRGERLRLTMPIPAQKNSFQSTFPRGERPTLPNL